MGKTTITVTIDETGESRSCTINVLEPEFKEGFWTSDEAGTTPIKKAKLGDTVYFHINTGGLADHQEITLKLREQDKNIFMTDWVDPDDKKFPEEEVVKKATIKDDKAVVALVLQTDWESMIADDSDNAFSLDATLELYWEVSYGWRKKELPNSDDDYLHVGFPTRTLYFKTPVPEHNLPEFISYDGDPMLLMEFGQGFVEDEIVDQALDQVAKKSASQIKKIAFVKLKKGYMVDNNGKEYTGQRLIYEYKEMYSNSGELFENVQKGKNFGYNHGNGLTTTKGISQYDYFSQKGKRVTLLGAAKKLGNAFDVFSLVKFAGEDLDTSEPLSMPLGPLSLVTDVAGILVQHQKAEMDEWLEEVVQLEIDLAKLEGLEATRRVVNSWNHNDEFRWELLPVSNQTANKLLAGKFKTFQEFFEFSLENNPDYEKIEVLYRKIFNSNREEDIYIIETIFINEAASE